MYEKTPFTYLRDTYRKVAKIKDPSHEISFRDTKNVLLLHVLRGFLQRVLKKRLTIAQLLAHPFICNRDSGKNECLCLNKAVLDAMQR